MQAEAVLLEVNFSNRGSNVVRPFESVEAAKDFVIADFRHYPRLSRDPSKCRFFIIPRVGELCEVRACTGCEEHLAVEGGALCARCAARQIGA